MTKKKIYPRVEGDFLKIDLGDGTFAFGRVLPDPLCAFYDLRTMDVPEIGVIEKSSIIFKIWVMNYAIKDGVWPSIGNIALDPALRERGSFFKKDAITKRLSIYSNGVFTKASLSEVQGLENAAVWEPEHVVSRLRDHFEGRPNKWVELLRADRA